MRDLKCTGRMLWVVLARLRSNSLLTIEILPNDVAIGGRDAPVVDRLMCLAHIQPPPIALPRWRAPVRRGSCRNSATHARGGAGRGIVRRSSGSRCGRVRLWGTMVI